MSFSLEDDDDEAFMQQDNNSRKRAAVNISATSWTIKEEDDLVILDEKITRRMISRKKAEKIKTNVLKTMINDENRSSLIQGSQKTPKKRKSGKMDMDIVDVDIPCIYKTPPKSPKQKKFDLDKSSHKITEYFSPSSSSPVSIEATPTKKCKQHPKVNPCVLTEAVAPQLGNSDNPKSPVKIKLSPQIKHSPKKFLKVKQLNEMMSKEVVQVVASTQSVTPSTSSNQQAINKDVSSERYIKLFEAIIIEELQHLKELILLSRDLPISYESPITDEEVDIIVRFLELKQGCKELYIRMLCRKHCWIRISKLNYPDISSDLRNEVYKLNEQKFVNTALENEQIEVVLEMLLNPELKLLCNKLKIPVSNAVGRSGFISGLIDNLKNQKSVADLYSNKKGIDNIRMKILRQEIDSILGPCMILDEPIRNIFKKIVLLYSLVWDNDEEDKRMSNVYFRLLNINRGGITYPNYELSRTIIFQKHCDFLLYFESLQVLDDFEKLLAKKDHPPVHAIVMLALDNFQALLKDKHYRIRCSKMEPFLKRFSAGAVYVNILTKYCENMKTKSNKQENIDILKELLGQQTFCVGQRGKWYELLYGLYQNQKKSSQAGVVIVTAMKDEHVDDVSKLSLQMKAKILLKRKTKTIQDEELVRQLEDLSVISVQEPASIEIKGCALEFRQTGMRLVYVQETAGGKQLSSVEEQALQHYQTLGYIGVHNEGALIKSIFGIIFWDVIYGVSPPGVFQSIYQDRPLDLSSRSFYASRKELIDERLEDLSKWSLCDVKQFMTIVIEQHRGVTSVVVSWDSFCKSDTLHQIVECLGMTTLQAICKRYATSYRLSRSGFPDLTIWDVSKKKCKFVEVKSPSDKLSAKQRLWMDFLRKVGADCEVCNIKHTSGKKK